MTKSAQWISAAASFAAGQLDEAERLCREGLEVQPGHPMGFGLLAAIANVHQDFPRALYLAEQAIGAADGVALFYVEKAAALFALEQYAKAAAAARQAVDIDPEVPRGYFLLSHAKMPGESYRDIIRRFHAWLAPRSYVEIGVAQGKTLALAQPPCVAVGIDPRPNLHSPLDTTTKIVSLESDVYFAKRDLRTDLETDCVDLAFIDGLHEFRQVLRDFINVEHFAAKHTVVLVHDCIPLDALTASPERRSKFWTGDAWKLIAALGKWRPDLDIQSVATPPSGLGVICRLDPDNRVLGEHYGAIVAEFLGLAPPLTPHDQHEQLSVVDNDWTKIAARVARGTGRKAPCDEKKVWSKIKSAITGLAG